MTKAEAIDFPAGGYPNLELGEVFRKHGVVQGLTELDRRSYMPPTATAKAEIAAEIIHELVSQSLDGIKVIS